MTSLIDSHSADSFSRDASKILRCNNGLLIAVDTQIGMVNKIFSSINNKTSIECVVNNIKNSQQVI